MLRLKLTASFEKESRIINLSRNMLEESMSKNNVTFKLNCRGFVTDGTSYGWINSPVVNLTARILIYEVS